MTHSAPTRSGGMFLVIGALLTARWSLQPIECLARTALGSFRGERSRSHETGCVSLGLRLARRRVEAHDGSIDVSSTVNVGTVVPGQA